MSSIGVFDSGHGGLTVLRALVEAEPRRPYVFLGDHAHAPYGQRSVDEIFERTVAGVDALFVHGARLVVIACNTAAAVALRRLQQTWLPHAHPGRNVLGVLVPMVEAITRVPWMMEEPPIGRMHDPRTVAVFATPRTVESGSFPREIAKRAPDVEVLQQACPGLVPMIEAGASDADLMPLVSTYAEQLLEGLGGRRLDAVVLGCTHYPLIAHLFADVLPEGVEVLDQPHLTARSLDHYLERHPAFAPELGRQPVPVRFLTTGHSDRVGMIASRFFGGGTDFERVDA